jgi:hypothetical protein
MRLVRILLVPRGLERLEPNEKDNLMISEISRAASLTELTSNPKSFFNCPDLHGGVPSLPGGRFRSGEIRLLDAASKLKALQKSMRPRRAKNAEEKPSSPFVGTQARTNRLILAAIRLWELNRGYPRLVRSAFICGCQ